MDQKKKKRKKSRLEKYREAHARWIQFLSSLEEAREQVSEFRKDQEPWSPCAGAREGRLIFLILSYEAIEWRRHEFFNLATPWSFY